MKSSRCWNATKIDGHWHNNMLRAIASMIGKGWTDEADSGLAASAYCEDGANDRDLDPMIKGGAKEGWGESRNADDRRAVMRSA